MSKIVNDEIFAELLLTRWEYRIQEAGGYKDPGHWWWEVHNKLGEMVGPKYSRYHQAESALDELRMRSILAIIEGIR